MNKNNYTYKKLGEVCEIQMGQSPESKTYNSDAKGLPFFQGNADFGEIYPTVRVYCDCPIRIAQNNDLLISVRAPIGAVNFADCKCCIGRGLASVRTIKGVTDEKYIFYFLKSINSDLNKQGTGSTFKSISKNILSNALVPVPPLATQRKIVAELDCLNNIITKKRLQLQDYDSLAQALFHQTFGDPVDNDMGWEVKKLGEVCDVGSSKRIYQSEQTKNGIPFYRISDIVYLINNEIPIPELFISEEKFKELKSQNLVPAKNDILITSRGTLGTCYIIKETDKFYFQDGMISWLKNIDKKILSLFISFLFKNNSFRTQIDKFQSGSTVAYLSISMLKKTNIIVPPLPLQQQFAAKIEAIEAQKARIRQSVAEVQTLLNYTMDKYFG